jgi:hypothetical protein
MLRVATLLSHPLAPGSGLDTFILGLTAALQRNPRARAGVDRSRGRAGTEDAPDGSNHVRPSCSAQRSAADFCRDPLYFCFGMNRS